MSLIHWWPLNGDTKDYGTKSLDGSLLSGTSYDNSGKIGKCLLADSGSLYTGHGVDIPSNLVSELSDTDYSFAAWVKPMGNHVHYEGAIISSGDWNRHCWAFGLNSANTAINPAGNWYNTAYVNYTFTTGQWYHIVSVQQNTTNKVYVNGELVGTVSHGHIYESDASDTCIGRETYAGGYFGFNGYINDVRIYDHALSAKEVKEISKGLVLHYTFEDPYIEGTTNLSNQGDWWTGWDNSGNSTRTQNDTTLISPTNTKIFSQTQTVAGQSALGFGVTDSLPSKTITASVWFYRSGPAGSDSVAPLIRGYDTDSWNGFSYNGTTDYREWPSDRWILLTKTFTTSSSEGKLYFCCYTGGLNEKFAFTGWQIEEKDHATPYVNGTRSAGTVYDSSGYGYDGTVDGSLQVSVDSACGKYSLVYDSDYTHNVESSMNPSFLDNGMTLMMWVKNNNNFLLANGQSSSYYLMAMDNSDKWCGGTSGTPTYYVDGVVNAGGRPTDGNWHLYTVVLTGGVPSWTKLYFNKHDSYWVINGKVADIKIYATALSASDILAEYQRKAAIDRNGNLFTEKIEEASLTNLIEIASYGIASQTWTTGLSSDQQGNCTVSLTSNGYRIYRTPNHDGQAIEGHGWDNWGGMRIMPLDINPNLFQKGHTYILKWHVKGQTCDSFDPYWTNQMGWGGGGLNPNPSNVEKTYIPAGFNGEKDCYYKFTINDDVYKVCTYSYSGFTQGQTYPSYRDFTFGTGYSVTNEIGTDLYVTNIRLYDITNLSEQEIQILKTGVISCEDIYEGPDTNVRLEKSRTFSAVNIKEN